MNIRLKTLLLVVGVTAMLAMPVFAQKPATSKEKVNFDFTPNPPAKKTKKTPRARIVAAKAEVKEKPAPKKSVSDVPKGTKSTRVLPSADLDVLVVSTDAEVLDSSVQPVELVKVSPITKEPVVKVSVTETRSERIERRVTELLAAENAMGKQPTETYKVGVGDVLFVSLQSARDSYYVVSDQGTIDYPLAGGQIQVTGLMTESIEKLLEENIQLFDTPKVTVKVRDHNSHAVDVDGAVMKSGKQMLQRDAMPLFVIRASVNPTGEARAVRIVRGETEIRARVGSREFDNMLVIAGDRITFLTEKDMPAAVVELRGKLFEKGEYEIREGFTLTQFIFLVGKNENGRVKKAEVKRKDKNGKIRTTKVKVSSIAKGETPDIVLEDGDVVELKS